jgi:hypothetical protein
MSQPRKHPKTASHNWLVKLVAMFKAGMLPEDGVNCCEIQHDDWCDLLSDTGFCNCDATIIPPVESRHCRFCNRTHKRGH